jgi:hypothetical protein
LRCRDEESLFAFVETEEQERFFGRAQTAGPQNDTLQQFFIILLVPLSGRATRPKG